MYVVSFRYKNKIAATYHGKILMLGKHVSKRKKHLIDLKNDHFQILPVELIFMILSYLNLSDLTKFAFTSKFFWDLINGSHIINFDQILPELRSCIPTLKSDTNFAKMLKADIENYEKALTKAITTLDRPRNLYSIVMQNKVIERCCDIMTFIKFQNKSITFGTCRMFKPKAQIHTDNLVNEAIKSYDAYKSMPN